MEPMKLSLVSDGFGSALKPQDLAVLSLRIAFDRDPAVGTPPSRRLTTCPCRRRAFSPARGAGPEHGAGGTIGGAADGCSPLSRRAGGAPPTAPGRCVQRRFSSDWPIGNQRSDGRAGMRPFLRVPAFFQPAALGSFGLYRISIKGIRGYGVERSVFGKGFHQFAHH